MKKHLLSFVLFLCAVAATNTLHAQPAHRPVQVLVSPDHSVTWNYKVNEPVVFTIQVFKNNGLLKDAVIDYELGPECYPVEKKQNVVLKDGKLTLKSTMKVPGFLQCRVWAKVDGQVFEGLANAGIEADKIEPTTTEPKDFDSFWANSIAYARKAGLNPTMTLLPERCTGTQNTYHVSFQTDPEGSRIYGILMVPKAPGKYPAVLQVPGAGIRPYNGFNCGDKIISLEIGIHGIPVNLPQEVYRSLSTGALRNYMGINKDDRDKFYYKRVYLGCVRAVDFLFSLPEFDGANVGVTGSSQGGALSFVTAALDPRIKFLAAMCPALCDYAGYLHNRAGGWPHYFKTAKAESKEVETLAYYDVVNFARRIKVEGWYSWGYNDLTCPPTSMFSAYNVVQAPKELKLFLDSGHWNYPEQNMARFVWIKKILNIE